MVHRVFLVRATDRDRSRIAQLFRSSFEPNFFFVLAFSDWLVINVAFFIIHPTGGGRSEQSQRPAQGDEAIQSKALAKLLGPGPSEHRQPDRQARWG